MQLLHARTQTAATQTNPFASPPDLRLTAPAWATCTGQLSGPWQMTRGVWMRPLPCANLILNKRTSVIPVGTSRQRQVRRCLPQTKQLLSECAGDSSSILHVIVPTVCRLSRLSLTWVAPLQSAVKVAGK